MHRWLPIRCKAEGCRVTDSTMGQIGSDPSPRRRYVVQRCILYTSRRFAMTLLCGTKPQRSLIQSTIPLQFTSKSQQSTYNSHTIHNQFTMIHTQFTIKLWSYDILWPQLLVWLATRWGKGLSTSPTGWGEILMHDITLGMDMIWLNASLTYMIRIYLSTHRQLTTRRGMLLEFGQAKQWTI